MVVLVKSLHKRNEGAPIHHLNGGSMVKSDPWDAEEEACPPSNTIHTMGDFRRFTRDVPDDAPFTFTAPFDSHPKDRIPVMKEFVSDRKGTVEVIDSTSKKGGVTVCYWPHEWF